jgi:hypothetical protein
VDALDGGATLDETSEVGAGLGDSLDSLGPLLGAALVVGADVIDPDDSLGRGAPPPPPHPRAMSRIPTTSSASRAIATTRRRQ